MVCMTPHLMDEHVRRKWCISYMDMCVLEDVSWAKCVFRALKPWWRRWWWWYTAAWELQKHTRTHNELSTTGTFTWRGISNLPPYTHVWMAIFSAHRAEQNRTWQWRWKNFWQMNFRQRTAIIILQEIEQFASLMVFDLDNQASSVNNIYDWYEVKHEWISNISKEIECSAHANMYGLDLIWPEIIWSMSVTNWTCSS